MQLLKKRGLLIFWILLLLDCFFIYTKDESHRIFTKPLLIPILCFYIFLNARKNHYHNTKTLVFLALVFAWLGDILLMQSTRIFFLLGMLAFALTHIFLSITYYRIHKLKLAKCQEAFLATIVVSFICVAVYQFVKSELGSLKIPVIAYMVVISVMAILSANLLGSGLRKTSAINYFIPGAALFIFSDAVLISQMFVFNEIDFLPVIVMLSYGYAISLIGEGFSKLLKG